MSTVAPKRVPPSGPPRRAPVRESDAFARAATGGGERDACADGLDDLRFRALVGAEAWARLAEPVRARFGRRLGPGATITYTGTIDTCRANPAGRALAQLLRLVGGPLPTSTDTGVPATVAVTEDEAAGGQFWTRVYGRHRGFPTIVHSSKRFAGPTGLEEHVGFGIGVALVVSADERALHFDADHWFVGAGRLRLRLPRWLGPGSLRVSHTDLDGVRFEFSLHLAHRLFGELVHQIGTFAERR